MIRTHLIKALYDNLLGPRSGHEEVVEEPFLKYELGILNSSHSLRSHSRKGDSIIDAEINPNPYEVSEEATGSPDNENTHELEVLRQEVDGELNFKTGACSLGLSFVLEGDSPRFKICLTWARYLKHEDAGPRSRLFQRHPNFYVTEWLDPDTKTRPLELRDTDRNKVTAQGAVLHILSERIENSNRRVVKIFLENRTEHDVSKIQTEKERIFQPQIRVCVRDSRLADLDTGFLSDPDHDYGEDDLLYRNSRTKARGFLCAAVWKEVDPESDMDGTIGRMSWPDSASVPKDVVAEFLHPDARTEYLPLYAILQPSQSGPDFDASELAQTWEPDDIDGRLKPITANYSAWIKEQRQKLDEMMDGEDIDPQLKIVGETNLQQCTKACKRIESGIEFLKTDERARIAFCFMNVVMNDKRMNEENSNLRWREFQMAFMLQCLRGISGTSEDEREIADILWFPTGGGKTEAYLGLVIFCIAYRRLASGGKLNSDGGVSVISRYTLRLLTIQQFQRSLGAIVAADVRRVENWAPDAVQNDPNRLKDPDLGERLRNRSMWGLQRFSIGLWIGGDITPKEFPINIVDGGKRLLNCEGALLPEENHRRPPIDIGDPAQIHACPVCQGTLCLAKESEEPGTSKRLTWIIKSPKSPEELERIPKGDFERKKFIVLENAPIFQHIGDSNGRHYYRMTAEIAPAGKKQSLTRKDVDEWWRDFVRLKLDPDPNGSPLESTRPSMPGYFFLRAPNLGRPHDFAIFCTNKDCKLNRTAWSEKQENVRCTLIPEPFRIGAQPGTSTSVPISAFTYDEQVYYRCPSFVIATVDKFANLPFEPRCASLFGNVDSVHPEYGGYGRKKQYRGPIQNRGNNQRVTVDGELRDVAGFCPPSLIIQDELHLIEGQLGSMVGAYEMAVDVLSDHDGLKPKYIASSATIKEAKSQVGTIFRRDAATFPPPGIDSLDNHFSEIEEDIGCARDLPGRVYLGIATSKSTVTLPIKAQSIIMSEIFKIRSNPEDYGLDDGTDVNMPYVTDPYWTFVSYFTDLSLLSRFTRYYMENITDNVWRWSRTQIFNSDVRAPSQPKPPGLRFYPITSSKKMVISSISVYCTKSIGRIKIAAYKDGSPIGSLIHKFDPQDCRIGENDFKIPKDGRIGIKAGDVIWIGLINDDEESDFESVSSDQIHFKDPSDGVPDDFPDTVSGMREGSTGGVRLSINSQDRSLDEKNNIQLSSATKSDELPKHLEQLKKQSRIDSLQTSPVFGTGIDIDRLGIMEVMNQPKTNAAYIQSSGRVGRNNPGLVISWLRAGRVRDLNHYENFIGYHRMLHRFVEPITAAPFSHKAMDLCLGPMLVAILRNARTVLQTRVDQNWIGSKGPLRMADHSDDPEIGAIREALQNIVSADPIAPFRRMPPARFERMFDESKVRWREIAKDRQKDRPQCFEYEERRPLVPPSKNVVLGTPNHADLDLDYVYGDVPNSLRQTESTAAFYQSEMDPVQIRPSQFITRYGPGELITGKKSTWAIPSISALIFDLSGKGNFDQPNQSGQQGLHKYAVDDARMKRILHRFNPTVSKEKLKLFSLPTNSSLTMADSKPVFRCIEFPQWAICHSRSHPSRRFLIKILPNKKEKDRVRCPECKRLLPSGDGYTTEFYSVRYVLACNNGHLGDLDWKFEVHGSSNSSCKGDVFEWDTASNNDNVEISCVGHWGINNNFVKSSCKSKTDYFTLKTRSKRGQLRCGAQFVEGGNDPTGCHAPNGMSQARMISKTQMSIRMPVVTTTMEIQRYKGELFESYEHLAQPVAMFSHGNPRASKQEFIDLFLQKHRDILHGITDSLIRQMRRASDSAFRDLIEDIKTAQKPQNKESKWLSEYEALVEELSSMEKQARDRGADSQNGGDDPSAVARIPVKFHSLANLHFEAMAFEDIRVTQVQSGYTREVSPPRQVDVGQEDTVQDDGRRVGEIVYNSERYTDEDDRVWYMANQLRGEGIFLHLDPDKHDDAGDVFRNRGSTSWKAWNRIHEKTEAENRGRLENLKSNGGSEQHIDALELVNIYTNPLFVWWHSFAHELINQISIDSGFMGVSLGERVYCVRKPGGALSAGIFIYAAVPGADGTLGGLTSLVNADILRPIIGRTLRKIQGCSNDPVCSGRKINENRRNGAACHVCLMNSETSCAYRNRFLDRNLVSEALSVRYAKGAESGG